MMRVKRDQGKLDFGSVATVRPRMMTVVGGSEDFIDPSKERNTFPSCKVGRPEEMQNPSLPSVRIVEVGPRDGLQNIRESIDSATKVELIRRLRGTGLQTIELTSFVSPRAIPQLADGRKIVQNSSIQQLIQDPGLRLPVLVPNIKGLQSALEIGVKEVAVFVSASEGFSKANINCSVDEGLDRAQLVAYEAARAGVAVRGYVSCIFEDPYDGPTALSSVLRCTRALLEMGCYEVSLGDTLGIGSPADVRNLLEYLQSNGVPLEKLAGHFHDTYGGAMANVWEAYNCGVRVFDSSVAGLGGCPFAPGAKGNVASEDLVYMFQRSGVDTGINLSKLVSTGVWISTRLSKENSSRAGTALAAKQQSTFASKNPPHSLNLKIILNRPRNGNALTTAMISEVTFAVKNAADDPSISRIILVGNGQFFCTGMDLARGSTPVGQGHSSSDAQYERLVNLFEAIDQSPKVTIACLNGPAFGGGVGLAFACDIRIAVTSATVTLSEVKLGLCPATISKYVIREWGVAFAREAMLTARSVTPEELKARGLVAQVANSVEELHLHLDRLLTHLKATSPAASCLTKDLVRLAWAHAGQEEQTRGIKALFEAMMRPDTDGSHGVKEFQAKRPVDWDNYTLQQQLKPKL
ncbi:hypothetical protein AOCH_001154 [Aspergillus ochraceoroseus]|uniref:hydroxymethylglutaryl-CoA lyase n=1 Tax=Aspergillus ochraceoroseus TaxID=138278 RepID=A0A0F8WVR3_9EURO|nr:hypothetical protein AOCH_001154 [Aspergillus ochraceoroseus]